MTLSCKYIWTSNVLCSYIFLQSNYISQFLIQCASIDVLHLKKSLQVCASLRSLLLHGMKGLHQAFIHNTILFQLLIFCYMQSSSYLYVLPYISHVIGEVGRWGSVMVSETRGTIEFLFGMGGQCRLTLNGESHVTRVNG